MARLRPISRAADAEDSYYELLVLRSEAEEARKVLFDQNLYEIT